MKKQQVAKKSSYLFIDGTNLYAAQYELFGPNKFLDFPRFIFYLESKLDLKFSRIYFYASYSPKPKRSTKKSRQYLKNEGIFYKSVRSTKKVVFFKGYRSKSSGKEKEVDVKMAIDIVDFAHRDLYENCYFISGDADFRHALILIEKIKKNVLILAIENRKPAGYLHHFRNKLIKTKHLSNLTSLITKPGIHVSRVG